MCNYVCTLIFLDFLWCIDPSISEVSDSVSLKVESFISRSILNDPVSLAFSSVRTKIIVDHYLIKKLSSQQM